MNFSHNNKSSNYRCCCHTANDEYTHLTKVQFNWNYRQSQWSSQNAATFRTIHLGVARPECGNPIKTKRGWVAGKIHGSGRRDDLGYFVNHRTIAWMISCLTSRKVRPIIALYIRQQCFGKAEGAITLSKAEPRRDQGNKLFLCASFQDVVGRTDL